MTVTDDHGIAALLASPVRRRLLDALANAASPHGAEPVGLSAAELARHVGLHVTTVRFHLDRLVAAGLVECAFRRRGGAGCPRKVYSVTPGSLADVDPAGELDSLRLLSALLAQALSEGKGGPAPTPAEVGRRWAADHVPTDLSDTPADTPGRWLSKVGRMLDVLLEWGYTPELTTDKGGRAAKVVLEACPFLGQARTNPAVVCGIHRGLIAGALTQFGETDTEVGLEPFVGPTTCVAHVSTRTPFRTIAPTAPNASAPSTTASKEPA